MNPIDALFEKLKASRRKAFMPFITAGDPSMAVTSSILSVLGKAGADLIEIGFPFSDPVADGPVIQASYTRALKAGFKVDTWLETLRTLSQRVALPPLVGMVSQSIVHKKKPAEFLNKCREAGLSGLIIPDLPVEEAEAIAGLAAEAGLKLILLVTPTTSEPRVRQIANLSTGFLYCVSLVGITGERDRLPENVKSYLDRLRKQTTLPLCVGFGVSTPEHVKLLRDHVDGVIVGSALVRKLENIDPREPSKGIEAVLETASQLAKALNPAIG